METVFAQEAPAAVGPFSHAMVSNGFLYCSGQIGINPKTMRVDGKSIEEQTLQVFENIKSVLTSKGLTLADLVKVNVYLTDMANFSKMNSVYADQFGMHRPTRTTVAVAGLPLGAIVEMECIAEYKPKS